MGGEDLACDGGYLDGSAPQNRAVLERLVESLGTGGDRRTEEYADFRRVMCVEHPHDDVAATQMLELCAIQAHAERRDDRQIERSSGLDGRCGDRDSQTQHDDAQVRSRSATRCGPRRPPPAHGCR